jgi:hypothetical protein
MFFLYRLEPGERRASDGPRVARRSEEEVLRLPAVDRRIDRGKDLSAASSQESAQLVRC